MSRRALLAGSLATLLAAPACGRQSARAAVPVTVPRLTADDPFYIAHRGGSGDWPEMTSYGYEQAARLPGLKALDVAVCRTSDGVLVCSARETTTRLTGQRHTILHEDWATLSRLTVTAEHTSDPTQPRRPLARFDDVVDAHIDDFVIVVEPRVAEAAGNLMAKLISLGQPERIVWKQPVTSLRFAEAKRHGFTTWGYVLNAPEHLGDNLKRFAASESIDLLGASRSRPDAFITHVAQAARSEQKKMIGWDVRDADDRARMLELGCQGLASSTIKELLAAPLQTREPPPTGR